MIGQFEKSIKQILSSFMRDPNVKRTITYTVYGGRSNVVDFQIDAVCSLHSLADSALQDQLSAQSAQRKYIIREQDLPAGVTVQSLTRNDRITDGDAELVVTDINKVLEFVIEITAVGGQ